MVCWVQGIGGASTVVDFKTVMKSRKSRSAFPYHYALMVLSGVSDKILPAFHFPSPWHAAVYLYDYALTWYSFNASDHTGRESV